MEYELAIKKEKFDVECPYPEIIKTYEEMRKKIAEKDGWEVPQIGIYTGKIRVYKEKLEKDKKLREIEAQKAVKQKEYDDMLKSQPDEEEMDEEEALKILRGKSVEELAQEEFRQEIEAIVEKEEKIARDYEISIRKGQFEVECIYPEVIKSYEILLKRVREKGLTDEAIRVKSQIKKYKDFLERDTKLRRIEVQKAQKDKAYEDLHKIDEANLMEKVLASLDIEESILNVEQIKQKKTAESEPIFNMIKEAETKAKEYEKNIHGGNLMFFDSPYEEIIETYKEARKKFEEIGWKEESWRLRNSVKFYEEKLINDNKLREFEEKKRQDAQF